MAPANLTAVEVERAFAALAQGGVVMPPILSMDSACGERRGRRQDRSYPRLDGFAIKVSPGFFDNPALGLPSLNGLMILLGENPGWSRWCFSTTATSPIFAPPPPWRRRCPATLRPAMSKPRG
ncbi:MAG: hypothetical protein R3D59_05645 [Paracoccaceae bacterium]